MEEANQRKIEGFCCSYYITAKNRVHHVLNHSLLNKCCKTSVEHNPGERCLSFALIMCKIMHVFMELLHGNLLSPPRILSFDIIYLVVCLSVSNISKKQVMKGL